MNNKEIQDIIKKYIEEHMTITMTSDTERAMIVRVRQWWLRFGWTVR